MKYTYKIISGIILLYTLVLVSTPTASEKAKDTSSESFTAVIKPFLENYCVGCHGEEKQKAKIRLDKLDPDLIHGKDADTWHEVLNALHIGEMPPQESKKHPTSSERRKIVEWFTSEFKRASELRRSSGGRQVLRRLTAYEYNNSLRDLLGFDLDFASDLPPEGTAKEGFKNNYRVLSISFLHMEYYETIARRALAKIINIPDRKPVRYFLRAEPEIVKPMAYSQKDRDWLLKHNWPIFPDLHKHAFISDNGRGHKKICMRLHFGKIDKGNGGVIISGNRKSDDSHPVYAFDRKAMLGLGGHLRPVYQPELRIEFYRAPSEAPLRIRVRAAAIKGKGGSYPILGCDLGAHQDHSQKYWRFSEKKFANVEVTAEIDDPQIYEFTVRPENFQFIPFSKSYPHQVKLTNLFRRGTTQLKYEDLPKLYVDWVEIEGNAYSSWPPESYNNILHDSPNSRDEGLYVNEILSDFMTRAYRRPVTPDEIEHKALLFHDLRRRGSSFKEALISTLTAVLCSPNFLLMVEPLNSQVEEGLRKRAINDYELASRLSYFLWSTMPDKELFQLADEEKLRNPEVLGEQVERMINDPKAINLAKNFSTQWLGIEQMHTLPINPEYFEFRKGIKDLFERETVEFVYRVMKDNMSILNFIDSEFAILHPELAKHYRIPGMSGGAFEKMSLRNEFKRGGLLTQGSILFRNSTGGESHPVKRGAWLLERILDDPPPPAPPNVPDIEDSAGSSSEKLSLKEKLEAHTKQESCRDCHSKIDPWGIAFENYNALGQWRQGNRDPNIKAKHQKITVDPNTVLKNGKVINDLEDLKQYILADKKEMFVRAMIKKMLSYSLGRYVEFSDEPCIEKILNAVGKDDFRFQTLIKEIALSETFLTK